MVEVDPGALSQMVKALVTVRIISLAYLLYYVARFGFLLNSKDPKHDFNNDPTEWLKFWWNVTVWGALAILTTWGRI